MSRGDYDIPYYKGWLASAAIPWTRSVGLVTEVSRQLRNDGIGDSFGYVTVVAGPKFTRVQGRARVFIQMPVGLVRDWADFYDGVSVHANSFVFQPGGGADVQVTDRVALRFVGDWLVVRPWYGVGLVTGMCDSIRASHFASSAQILR